MGDRIPQLSPWQVLAFSISLEGRPLPGLCPLAQLCGLSREGGSPGCFW